MISRYIKHYKQFSLGHQCGDPSAQGWLTILQATFVHVILK